MMKRILIGYNEKFLFDALVMIFSGMDTIRVIGGEKNTDLLKKINEYSFDILFLELGRIQRKDISFILETKQILNEKPLFIFPSTIHLHFISRIFEVQPQGFVLKSCNKTDLILAVEKVADGANYFCHKVTNMLYLAMMDEQKKNHHKLTSKELLVLKHVVNGETNYQIADALNICETTVKTHRKNIMRKLCVTNTFELIRYACREHLIDYRNSDFCSNCPCCN